MEKKETIKILLVFIFLVGLMSGLRAQQKLAQTGFQFLSVVPDARSAALANAMTTVANDASAIWDNPAMLAMMAPRYSVIVSRNNWIAGIQHHALSMAYRPFDGQFGVIGFGFLYVDYGEVEGTIVANNDQGYLETGIIRPNAYAISLAYSKMLTNKFSIGGQVKYVTQYLGPVIENYELQTSRVITSEQSASVLAFDFGTFYKTGLRSLLFGMSVRNFSEEIAFAEESFQLPLIFSIGFSANAGDFLPEMVNNEVFQNLMLSVDAVHPRSYPEYIKTGLEYRFQNKLALRVGYYSNNDERRFTYGLGLNLFGFTFDYAYVPFGVFENVQRFTIKFSWK